MKLEVHKFGGAAVKDAAGVKNVADILKSLPIAEKVVVVSATGKTTNALEKVAEAYFQNTGKATEVLESIKVDHFKMMAELGLQDPQTVADVLDTFVEIEWILEDEVQDDYDYLYDQIVSVGELISSKILSYYCLSIGLKAHWSDVRGLISTDNTYREARVDWNATGSQIVSEVKPAAEKADFVITQGFIGSSSENFTTTLGREGSDYTAAVFGYCLDAASVNIWKDVPGILTGDPSVFENVTKLERLDYREAIEMTYYGAKVIHPKTIKPLQNKSIPLHVRPYNDPQASGTVITADVNTIYPPIVVLEGNQTLLHISTKDFSFVAEQHLSEIFSVMTELNIKMNMMRNTAISFSACIQNYGKKIEKLTERLSEKYNVLIDENLELITIRHYDGSTKQALTEGKIILFEETINDTVRMAVKSIPLVKRKLDN